ncbi:TolC family protein [Massilia sp. RP-1-19]|uniref:TolC family protein n=1 Tax=Massilia polaris TaxID=2728846 RepID=A0A848HTS5_9BURK|nr:TolC family protein [Massilia polaris]NML63449.1 TolC family protein [Massilia polaris]
MRACRLSLCIAGAAIFLPCLAVAAPFAPVTGATLKTVIENAWARSAQVSTLEARQEEAAAARSTARSWIAGSPTLSLSQRNDRSPSQREQRESELSLSAPVWLPGQKTTREAWAARSSEEVSAQLLQARLAVAGEVRIRLWEAAAAREVLAEKDDHLHHMEQLAAAVARRVRAGDLARSDGLLAQQEVHAAQVDVALARTRAAEALARYRVLTGFPDLPSLEPEPLRDVAEPVNARLAAARATVSRAQAGLRMAEAARGAPPSFAVSLRHEQERNLGEPNRSIGIALQIPLGSEARNRPAETLARTQIATAAADAAQAEASVALDASLAQEQLANAQAALDAATSRATALHEYRSLIENAFRLGERGLAEVLRANALTHEADVAVRQQRVALGLAHAQLNQARGILP